jgi:hypothetical protein
MSTLPVTGVAPVDAELQRRAPFANANEAEVMAAKLLAVWRALQPGSVDDMAASQRQNRQRR